MKARKGRDPAVHGKQSVKKLLGQNQGAANAEIEKEGIKGFERLAKKYGVDFAVRRIKRLIRPAILCSFVQKIRMLWMPSAKSIRQGH